ncbi:hypothetical protein KKI23_01935 [Patescibacteria group bacterium]|nr:hypothetical protein [Patescibacteria group bacterium]
MEFKDHLRIIGRGKVFIIIFTLLVVLVSLVWAYYKPPVYQSSISFSVNRINRQSTEYYEYDGYYAISASELFSQTLMSWFMTPSVLLEIYEEAGVDPEIKSLASFTNRFKARQYASQNIVVTFKEKNEDEATKISQSIINTVQTKSAELNQTVDQKSIFEVVGSGPVVVSQKPGYLLTGIISLISGLIVSLILVYLRRYFKEATTTT